MVSGVSKIFPMKFQGLQDVSRLFRGFYGASDVSGDFSEFRRGFRRFHWISRLSGASVSYSVSNVVLGVFMGSGKKFPGVSGQFQRVTRRSRGF